MREKKERKINCAVSSVVTVRRWNQTAMSSERLQNCGNERIREEVRRIHEKYERCTRNRHQDEIALSSGATAVSSQSCLDATLRDNTWCLRPVVYRFFIIRISIQGQTPQRWYDLSGRGLRYTSQDVVSLPPAHMCVFLPSLVQKFNGYHGPWNAIAHVEHEHNYMNINEKFESYRREYHETEIAFAGCFVANIESRCRNAAVEKRKGIKERTRAD